jgi:hypothetical protein
MLKPFLVAMVAISCLFVGSAVGQTAGETYFLEKDGYKVVITLPERWTKKSDAVVEPERTYQHLNDSKDVAHITMSLARSRQGIAKDVWLSNSASGFFGTYTMGFTYTVSEMTPKPVKVNGHEGLLNSYKLVINGKTRFVEIAAVDLTPTLMLTLTVSNRGVSENPGASKLLDNLAISAPAPVATTSGVPNTKELVLDFAGQKIPVKYPSQWTAGTPSMSGGRQTVAFDNPGGPRIMATFGPSGSLEGWLNGASEGYLKRMNYTAVSKTDQKVVIEGGGEAILRKFDVGGGKKLDMVAFPLRSGIYAIFYFEGGSDPTSIAGISVPPRG